MMADFPAIRLDISSQADIIVCRQKAREAAVAKDFSLADQTRLATAVSELARNALHHGGGGTGLIQACKGGTLDVPVHDEYYIHVARRHALK